MRQGRRGAGASWRRRWEELQQDGGLTLVAWVLTSMSELDGDDEDAGETATADGEGNEHGVDDLVDPAPIP